MILTTKQIKALRTKQVNYKVYDERGLFLLCHKNGSFYWRMRFKKDGREKVLSFGLYPAISLSTAHELRDEAFQKIVKGIDPASEKFKQKAELKNTFQSVFNDWWKKRQLKNLDPRTEQRIKNLFDESVLPVLGGMPVSAIKVADITKALSKLEKRGSLDTMRRLRTRISSVLNHAILTDRLTYNVAVAMTELMPEIKVTHFAALTTPKDVTRLLLKIENSSLSPVKQAGLKLLALWFLRSNELRFAQWSDVDWDENRLVIPAERTKGKKCDLIIPLALQAKAILKMLQAHFKINDYILPSVEGVNKPRGQGAFRADLAEIGFTTTEHTPHGFRAMARTLLDEELSVEPFVVEQQLGHAVSDSLGRAYNRTTHIKQRTEMMQRWADYLDKLRFDGLD